MRNSDATAPAAAITVRPLSDRRNKRHRLYVYLFGQVIGLCGSVAVAGSKLREARGAFLYDASQRPGLRAMSLPRPGKAIANEQKYPFIIAVPVAANGLDVELNNQIVGFHKSRRIPPKFGRSMFRDG
jgi:hypothetical protein